jgi:hypothetical protein
MQFSFTKGGRQYSYMDWRSEVQQIERSYQFSLESVQWFNGSMVQWFNGSMDGWMDITRSNQRSPHSRNIVKIDKG